MIVIGATLTTFATGRPETCLSWLDTAEELQTSHPAGVRFFAALEVDARGVEPFQPLVDRLAALDGEFFTFTYDDHRTQVTTHNRLSHICAGRNIVTDYAQGNGVSHILFLDADMRPPGNCLPKLLELDHPLVGGEVPTYGLRGPTVDRYPFPVQEHWNTAGFLLAARSVFRFVRWRWDGDAGMSDDPCYAHDAREFLGVPTYVRKDVVGAHWPAAIPAIEQRGYDTRVIR